MAHWSNQTTHEKCHIKQKKWAQKAGKNWNDSKEKSAARTKPVELMTCLSTKKAISDAFCGFFHTTCAIGNAIPDWMYTLLHI